MIKKTKTSKITGKESMYEIVERCPESAEILMESGMHCVGCSMAMQESLNDGCLAHGIDPKKVIEKINKKIK